MLADGVPRYAPPTQEELEDMFREPTPAEAMGACAHCEACLRVLGMLAYAGEVNRDVAYWEDDAARILGCGEDGACDLWEEE